MTSAPHVRPATPDDADAIAIVQVAAWRWACAEVMSPDFLAGLDPARSAEQWHTTLATAADDVGHARAPACTTLVAEIGGSVVAAASYGPFRGRVDGDPSGELWSLNAHPDAFGTGAGTRLEVSVAEGLAVDGHDEAALWVVEQNPRARRFYERQGWRPDGVAREDEVGGSTVSELRYHRTLGHTTD